MTAAHLRTSVIETPANGNRRSPTSRFGSRAKRPRSAVTSGRSLFIGGDPHSKWSRRFHDLIVGHVSDLGGPEVLSEAQFSLIRRCAAMECELERLDAQLSRDEPVDMDRYGRAASHLRRIFETLGIERKQRDVGPTLGQLIREDQDAQRERLARERQAEEATS
jgi:hypothetical protein